MSAGKSYEVTTVMYGYEKYKENSVTGKYITHYQVKSFLNKLENDNTFEISTVGSSHEGKNIDLIKLGSGSTKVFFWSQMHGDETTSTRAILDLFNFFHEPGENQPIRDKILRHITLYIIPMLNPDGAEKYTRRNSQLIDINRDAVAQQTPEGKILYKVKNEINPDWGFNLHDQSPGYSAGLTYRSSTISLLSPPFNEKLEINETRTKAMQIIVSLFDELSEIIPGHVARYDDEFEPRAFGDNFTKDGVATILIEAGGWNNDMQREYVRKLFFLSLLKSLLSIADQGYTNENPNNYFEIPENKERLYELVLRDVTIKKDDHEYKADIAIKHEPHFDEERKKIYYKGTIADLGDLSTYYGYTETNMSGFTLEIPKISENPSLKTHQLLNEGVLFQKSQNVVAGFTNEPINYYKSTKPDLEIKIDGLANFLLVQSGQIRYCVVNGFLIDLLKNGKFEGNGLYIPLR